MLFRTSIGSDLLVKSVLLRSDLLVRSHVGSACQIRFKSNLWFRSYLVGYAVQTILGQICWSDQLVGSVKSDLWFRSCLVGYAVQSIYWVRSVGQISLSDQVSQICGSHHVWSDIYAVQSIYWVRSVGQISLSDQLSQICGSHHVWLDICGSDHIWGQICRSDQITFCQICLSDQCKSNLWFRSYLVG